MSIDTGTGHTYKENYPIAGINQSSQQFRDNFTVLRYALENLHNAEAAATSVLDLALRVDETTGQVTVNLFYPDITTNPEGIGTQRYRNGTIEIWGGTSWSRLIALGTPEGKRAVLDIVSAQSSTGADTIMKRDATGGVAVGALKSESVTSKTALLSGTTLAEIYSADAAYEPGTVLVFGGAAEVTTTTTKGDVSVAGVVVENVGAGLSADRDVTNPTSVGLLGRARVKVIGSVSRGGMLVASEIAGYAIQATTPGVGSVIGKSLESKSGEGQGLVAVSLGRC